MADKQPSKTAFAAHFQRAKALDIPASLLAIEQSSGQGSAVD
ncbi:hypothetical protein [Halomonas denitrificans]|nr:hypothetical protein [Halomonas denitrificans]